METDVDLSVAPFAIDPLVEQTQRFLSLARRSPLTAAEHRLFDRPSTLLSPEFYRRLVESKTDQPDTRKWLRCIRSVSLFRDEIVAYYSAWDRSVNDDEKQRSPHISLKSNAMNLLAANSEAERASLLPPLVKAGPMLGDKAWRFWVAFSEYLSRWREDERNALCPIPFQSIQTWANAVLSETDQLAKECFSKDGLGWFDVLYNLTEPHNVSWPSKQKGVQYSNWLHPSVGWFEPFSYRQSAKVYYPVLRERLLNPATFTRLLTRFGSGFADACTTQVRPRIAAMPIHGFRRYRAASLFSTLLQTPHYLSRTLDFTHKEQLIAQRGQAKLLLAQLRIGAALAPFTEKMGRENRDAICSELTERLSRAFFRNYPPNLAMVFPAVHIVTPTKWLSSLSCTSDAMVLRDTFDEDWFRNPKCPRHLAEQWSLPYSEIDPSEISAWVKTTITHLEKNCT